MRLVSLPVGPSVKALSFTPETDSARSTRLSVLDVSDKLSRHGTPATTETALDGLVIIVHADFSSPAESAILSTASLVNLATDRAEILGILSGRLDRLETVPGDTLDSIKIGHSISPVADTSTIDTMNAKLDSATLRCNEIVTVLIESYTTHRVVQLQYFENDVERH